MGRGCVIFGGDVAVGVANPVPIHTGKNTLQVWGLIVRIVRKTH